MKFIATTTTTTTITRYHLPITLWIKLCSVIITVQFSLIVDPTTASLSSNSSSSSSSIIPDHIQALLEPSSSGSKDLLHTSLLTFDSKLDPHAPLQPNTVPELEHLQKNESLWSYLSHCYEPKIGGEVMDLFRHPLKHVIKFYLQTHFHFLSGYKWQLFERVKTLMSEIVFITKSVIKCVLDYAAGRDGGPKLGLTSLSAMTDEEYQNLFTYKSQSNSSSGQTVLLGSSVHAGGSCKWKKSKNLKKEFDWRKKGKIFPPIKRQYQCGSCYIFIGISAFEAAYARKHGKVTAFSEQQLVNCLKKDTCNGGSMDEVYQYLVQHGVVKEKKVPYIGEQKSCAKHHASANAKGWCVTTDGVTSDSELQSALHELGPLSIEIASPQDKEFKHLRGEWHGDCPTDPLTHGLVLVGWSKKEWILRNTWGVDWGKDGYLYLSRSGRNRCGMYHTFGVPFV